MYEDNNNGNNQVQNNCEYRSEGPVWQPDAEKYNTPPTPPRPPKKEKKSRWWIPVLSVMTALLAGIIVCGIILINNVKNNNEKSNDKVLEFATETKPQESSSKGQLVISEDEDYDDEAGVSYVLTDVSEVVEEVMPAVVSITSRQIIENYGYYNYYNFFFGGNSNRQNEGSEVEAGIGSGTIVGYNEAELLILTSYHVVEGCSSLYVTFVDGENVEGYVKGSVADSDIAVVAIRIDDIPDETYEQLKVATLCKNDVKVGEGTIVIGNALGYGQSVSTGIVSAKDRQITVDDKEITVIQTNAAINNGNSGGCMLNSDGEVIGISEAKITSSAVEGMCYAISIYAYYDQIMELLELPVAEDNNTSAKDDEKSVNQGDSPYLGIYGRDVTSDLAASYGLQEGIYIQSTVPGSGAEEAGLLQGDIIIGFNGKTVATMDELKQELANCKVGDVVTVVVLRYEGNRYVETKVDVKLTSAIG